MRLIASCRQRLPRDLLRVAMALLVAAAYARADEVPYVQTPQVVVDAMLELAGARGTDFLIDLGAGDGRIVITAAKRYGTRGLGVDYDRRLVDLATANARKAGVADRVLFVEKNIFEVDLAPATVLTLYLLPDVNLELRPKLLATLKPGTRIVSHDWDMGDWEPDAKADVDAPDKPVGALKKSTVYLWVVPARVAGKWRTRVPLPSGTRDIALQLEQHFSTFSGIATVAGAALPIERAYVRGPFVFFRFGSGERALRFQGHLFTHRMVGQVTTATGAIYRWRALREK